MSTRARITVSAVLALSVFVAAAALAWACVPRSSISLSTASGAPGTVVTVTGTGFPVAPVTLRWNETATLRTVEATGSDPNLGAGFTTTVTIPQAAPGCYTITATSGSPTALPAAAPFEIPGSACRGPLPAPTPTAPAPQSLAPALNNSGSVFPNRARRARAIRSCRRKYKAKRSTSAAKRRKLARKRAACIRRAKKRYSN